jgi:hypothetical protein
MIMAPPQLSHVRNPLRGLWQQDRFAEAELSIPYGPPETMGN